MKQVAVVLCLVVASAGSARAQNGSWLDAPLRNWNTSSAPLPKAPAADEPADEIGARCRITVSRDTPGERALAAAGWIPFRVFDRQIFVDGVEIIGGQSAADGMCRPMAFNVFVFAGGTLAGTLSPGLMDARVDGTIAAVRLSGATIAAEFARYTDADALCCPSTRFRVTYRIEAGPPPLVVPVTVRDVRK